MQACEGGFGGGEAGEISAVRGREKIRRGGLAGEEQAVVDRGGEHRAVRGVAWQRDPWARGSYSYALPGHAEDRAVLAAPVDNRLFFAGEATSPNFFSTAHGAYLSGLTAAEATRGPFLGSS